MKPLEELIVELDLPSLEPLPVAISGVTGNGKIDPVGWDLVFIFVFFDGF